MSLSIDYANNELLQILKFISMNPQLVHLKKPHHKGGLP